MISRPVRCWACSDSTRLHVRRVDEEIRASTSTRPAYHALRHDGTTVKIVDRICQRAHGLDHVRVRIIDVSLATAIRIVRRTLPLWIQCDASRTVSFHHCRRHLTAWPRLGAHDSTLNEKIFLRPVKLTATASRCGKTHESHAALRVFWQQPKPQVHRLPSHIHRHSDDSGRWCTHISSTLPWRNDVSAMG